MIFPKEYTDKINNILGDKATLFFETMEEAPCKGIRVNTLKLSVEVFLKKNPWGIRKEDGVSWCEDGFYYSEDEDTKELPPGKHPFHLAGAYYIQEPSAMSPVALIADEIKKSGSLKILDLCASPGGKSTQLACAMGGKGLLISNEINGQRAANLSENIERLGISNAIVVSHEPGYLEERFGEFFDIILVDAPCSGEGMFRKNPEAIKEWSPLNVDICIERQQDILKSAYAMLKEGGKLVYSTCTFEPGEDEDGISTFLENYPKMRLIKQHKLWPFEVKGEGHFLALMNKDGESLEGRQRFEKSLKDKEAESFLEFQKAALRTDIRDRYKDGGYTLIRFKDELYIAPSTLPELKGLRVLRPGLHLGTIKKDRFEPAHALALNLKAKEAVNTIELDYASALKYLKGETISGTDAKGWCLICYEGVSLGWGKASNGIIKNHYPKGLRIN